MSRELDAARKTAEQAVRSLANIAALPQNVGDQVRWTNNGCVWTRIGDDAWGANDNWPYSSAHVASSEYEHLSRGNGASDE
jgi:hypothetical protein